jgi:hypothetical protein
MAAVPARARAESSGVSLMQVALSQLEQACALEERLDVAARAASGVSDADAIGLASQATDAYMAACAGLMGALPALGGRMHALASGAVRLSMERIELLHGLMQHGGATEHRRLTLTEEERRALRERARLSEPTDSNEGKRTLVAKEIVATETSYVRALSLLQKHFIEPLTADSGPLGAPGDKGAVFGNVEEILGLAQSFKAALEVKMAAWGPLATLGDTFKQFAMFFKIYVMYTNSFREGVKRASELVKNDPYAKAVGDAASRAGCQDVATLMINPIQRLPRYVLLLKELRKRTPDGHPDARLLEGALADVQVVADHVNETLRRHEDNAKILEIQSALWTTKLGGVPVTLLEPGRLFIREGTLFKVRSIGTLRECKVFLFSDILMYCTSSKLWPGRYHYHNHLEYYGASRGDKEAKELGAVNVGPSFKVTSAQAVRVFICTTEKDCEEWMNLINACASQKRDLDMRRLSYGSGKRLNIQHSHGDDDD